MPDATSTPTLNQDTPEGGSTPNLSLAEPKKRPHKYPPDPRGKRPEFIPRPYRYLTTEEQHLAFPEMDAIKVRNMLGFSKERWDDAKMASLIELGKYRYVPIVARALMLEGWQSLEDIRRAMQAMVPILEAKSTDEDTQTMQVSAALAVAHCTKAMDVMMGRIQSSAERSSEKFEEDGANGSRPKNLPPPAPQVNLQVNVGQGSSPAGEDAEARSCSQK